MPAQNPQRRGLSANIKSAIATAAIVGVIGGWAAFGSQQPVATTTTSDAVAQAQTTIDTSLSSAPSLDTSASQPSADTSASQPSVSASSVQSYRQPLTITRSSR